jgi:UrcA family protein
MKHENLWVIFAAASASLAIIGGAATAALAQPPSTTTVVGARDPDAVNSTRVSYRDLNLAAASDKRILQRRVGGAARKVCTREDVAAINDLGFVPCVSDAWKGARPQIAMAVRRAQQIAVTGTSSIPMVAIAIVAR